MNDQLQKFARDELKDGLKRLPEANVKFFKRMYSHENLDADINDVVDTMPIDKLSHAMDQVSRTLQKMSK